MRAQLLQPQEVEVFYILPTIRSYMAQIMKEEGMPQREIARKLHIKDSTVSQYVNHKRASKITFDDGMVAEIRKSVAVIEDQMDLIRETQRLLTLARERNTLCDVHRQLSGLPLTCNIKEMNCN